MRQNYLFTVALGTAWLSILASNVLAYDFNNQKNKQMIDLPSESSFFVSQSFAIGQSVCVLWNGSWYPARIVGYQNGLYNIIYLGYGTTATVGEGRISNPPCTTFGSY